MRRSRAPVHLSGAQELLRSDIYFVFVFLGAAFLPDALAERDLKFLHTAGGIHKFFGPGVERVAGATDFYLYLLLC